MTPLSERIATGHATVTSCKTVCVRKRPAFTESSLVCVDRPPQAGMSKDEVEFLLVIIVDNAYMHTTHMERSEEHFATFEECEAVKEEVQKEINRLRPRGVMSRTAAWDSLTEFEKLHYFDRNVAAEPTRTRGEKEDN